MLVALDKIQEVSSNTNGAVVPLPALHPSRVEKMVFVRYSPPPQDLAERAEYDAWLEQVSYLCDDLHWLLQQPHDKFWCQVVFDEGLHRALDSFLQSCPRCYNDLGPLPEAGMQRQKELCRLVFLTYLRMSTHKESKEHFITPEVFGEILYNNFLFDIPKLFDLCALFGKANGPLLTKMVGNIFTQQPKYTEDLRQTLPTIFQVLGNIAARLGVLLETPSVSPQKLSDQTSCSSGRDAALTPAQLQDVLLYLGDTVTTLHRFLDVYPAVASVFTQQGFCSVLATFYETIVPELTNQLKQAEFPSPSVKKQLAARLQVSRRSLVHIFHTLVQHVCLIPVLENASNEELVGSCIEEFLHVMSAVLGERRFLAAYESMFSFRDNVDLLLQASSTIDASQFEYIQAAIDSAFATFGHRKSPRGNTNTGGRTSPDGAPDLAGSSAAGAGMVPPSTDDKLGQGETLPEKHKEDGAGLPRPSDVELDSLVSGVQDLLPHLGEGFIEIALKELGYDQEKVVSCVLEDKLPASLAELSKDMPRQARDLNQGDGQVDEEEEDILSSRRNVFDKDEFDIFHNRNVDMSKIHLGKKEQKINLEDKRTIQAVKATYDAYGSMDQESIYDNKHVYDDEYDDTYDTNAVGADDADSADELTNNRVLPRVLMDLERKKASREGKLEEESDGEDDGDAEKPPRDEFVADPAKLREQADQRRQSQQSARGGSGGRRGGQHSRDVKGAPKGQGQNSEVQHNRRVKQMHKGQRNRAAAEKKMSKGMF